MNGFLAEPRLKNKTVGSPEYFLVQGKLIKERPLLKYNYDCWYAELITDYNSTPRTGSTQALELGSGGSYLKDLIPSVITSDVAEGTADRVIDAQNLPFPDASLHCIFLTHCFHHIPNVALFLKEAERTLIPGGIISMIEVARTPMCHLLMKLFHREPFLPERAEWSFEQKDSMLDSNQALAWIVFVRDRNKFESCFPNLKLEVIGSLPWISYIFSGGVSWRKFLPDFLSRLIILAEKPLAPLRPFCGLSWHIRIRKT